MRKLLKEINIRDKDINSIISLFKHYEAHTYFSKFHFMYTAGISDETTAEVINKLLEEKIIIPVYRFCCGCTEEQIQILTQKRYDSLEYSLCESCGNEFVGEAAKNQYILIYKFIKNASKLCGVME